MAIAPKYLKSRNRDSKGKVKYIVKTTKKIKNAFNYFLKEKLPALNYFLKEK